MDLKSWHRTNHQTSPQTNRQTNRQTSPQMADKMRCLMKNKMRPIQLFVLSLTTVLLSVVAAQAYYTTMDTGEIVQKGSYRLMTETNVVFNDLSGLNLVGKFDLGMNESSNFRFLLGGGAVGFQTGVLYKWIPIPDFENQPAIGILGGFVYARNEGVNYLNLRFHPLISKKFNTSSGKFTPFAALPFGFTFTKEATKFPMQLALGTEWQPKSLKKLSFMLEGGFNLHESFGHIAFAALLAFDEDQGLKFE